MNVASAVKPKSGQLAATENAKADLEARVQQSSELTFFCSNSRYTATVNSYQKLVCAGAGLF